MTQARQGRAAEWAERKRLESEGWTVTRAAKSGSPYDLIAVRLADPSDNICSVEVLLVQVKASKSRARIARVEREELQHHVGLGWVSQMIVFYDNFGRKAQQRREQTFDGEEWT